MAAFVRTTVIDASPGADVVKQAVLDVDTDLIGVVAAYNAHDIATTNVHGSTGAATGTGAMVRATSPALVTPALGTPASGNLANCTGVPLNSQAIAENDVLVGAPTPFGSWVKKTLAEFKTILGLAITAGKTITCTQNTSLDEAVAMSSKAPKASPVFTGFSQLGDASVSIKVKKITGTSAAAAGGSVAIAHGITDCTKIISISVLVQATATLIMSDGYVEAPYRFSVYINANSINVTNDASSTAIGSKPVIIVIMYEE